MKNVTIALDDETHRAARIRAAELGTSLSALVKDYLTGLTNGSLVQGVREMPMPYITQPAAPDAYAIQDGPPWSVNGEWVYTVSGKPRIPGSLKTNFSADEETGEWPPEMLAFFDKLQSDPLDDAFDHLP